MKILTIAELAAWLHHFHRQGVRVKHFKVSKRQFSLLWDEAKFRPLMATRSFTYLYGLPQASINIGEAGVVVKPNSRG